jgi:nucleotide-binding universal stress UspA family protein
MHRFKNILVILNPQTKSTAALDRAVQLARRNTAKLTLLSVVDRHPHLERYPKSVARHLMTPIIAARHEWLQEIANPLKDNGIDVIDVVVEGTAFLEIIRQVLRNNHDMVITTSEEKKGLYNRLFGTTTMHLMRKCPCPVWVVKRAQARPFARILAAVDPSAHSSVNQVKHDSLNMMILQLAAATAREESGELHIIHASQILDESYLYSEFMIDSSIENISAINDIAFIEESREKARKQHKDNIDMLLEHADVNDLKPHLHLIEGEPEVLIPQLVEEEGIDLLVMGTVCRTGIAGLIIGNTAEDVLNQVNCSVLTVKPSGFVTPVTLEETESFYADE